MLPWTLIPLLFLAACMGEEEDQEACPGIAIAIIQGAITSPTGEPLLPDLVELTWTPVDAPPGTTTRSKCKTSDQGQYSCFLGNDGPSHLRIELYDTAWEWPVNPVFTGSDCRFPITETLDLTLPPE